MKSKIAAIIPALNEEATIASVVQACRASPYLDEVIVVSDGSIDATAARARAAGAIRVIEHAQPLGKGRALLDGVRATSAPILLFLDADLHGLTQEHIEQLVLPVIYGARDMNVGRRDRGPLLTSLTRWLPLLSGERALKRDIVEKMPPFYLKGFMVETALNYYCRVRRRAYGSIVLRGVTIRKKYQKVGWRLGIVAYGRMILEILAANVLVRSGRLIGRFPT